MSVANIDAIRRERKIRWKMYIHFVPTSDGRFKKINKKNKHVLEILGSVKWDKFLPSGRNLAAESTKNIKLPAKMSGGIKSKSFTNTNYTKKIEKHHEPSKPLNTILLCVCVCVSLFPLFVCRLWVVIQHTESLCHYVEYLF